MSRIHEALSKAVREREQNSVGALSPTLADIAAELNRDTIAATEEFVPHLTEKRPAPSAAMEEVLRRCAHYDWKFDPRTSIFAPDRNDKAGAERFRTLRSRLYQISENQKISKILVTSSLPSEGKSFVCANLALSMAQQQHRSVLLIDADLRKPNQHKLFGGPKAPGLSNYLRGEMDEYGVIQNGPQSNLFLIPGGDEVTNAGELILGEQLKKLVDFSRETFDWVIIDSPPSLAVHDASILADLCDGVLFVLRAASTDLEVAMKASSEFRRRNLLGIVLNCAQEEEASYGIYYS